MNKWSTGLTQQSSKVIKQLNKKSTALKGCGLKVVSASWSIIWNDLILAVTVD